MPRSKHPYRASVEGLGQQIRTACMARPETAGAYLLLRCEYRFAPPRRWRFDFCMPEVALAFEFEGGIWNRGRHTRGKGYANDCRKYNEAVLLGWRVLRFTAEDVETGAAAAVIERAMRQRSNKP